MKIKPIKLEGERVRLSQLDETQIGGLSKFCFDERIWRWYPYSLETRENLEFYVKDAVKHQNIGTHLPFAIIEKSSEKVVGSTRFMNINIKNRRVEIGSTWLDPKWQRTYVNTEAKLLMLTHAFETWNCIRVEFKTDALNIKSCEAILRIGAKEEGTHRQHMITESGRLRDSVYFSILDKEWERVKINLKNRLDNDKILA